MRTAFLLPLLALAEPAVAAAPTPPVAAQSLPSLFSVADYPKEALRLNLQGSVSVRLQIGADGVPKACRVMVTSSFEPLDSKTCEILMQRARFTPARDDRGKAVAGTFDQKINWRIAEGPERPMPMRLASAMYYWGGCMRYQAALLVESAMPVDEVVTRALAGCDGPRSAVEAEVSTDKTQVTADAMTSLREMLARQTRTWTNQTRANAAQQPSAK